MLMKADAAGECERTFAAWRAMLPHWNVEADRFRKLALAVRSGVAVQVGAFDEAEALIGQIRAAMERADSLLVMTHAGDPALPMLARASTEFEALIGSLQKTLEMAELVAGRHLSRPVQIIAHPGVVAGSIR
jgi:hypothetical protein